MKENPIFLSKSLFIRGLQCHKSLYLQKFRPELKDAITDEKEKLFSGGNEVGILAHERWPGFLGQGTGIYKWETALG